MEKDGKSGCDGGKGKKPAAISSSAARSLFKHATAGDYWLMGLGLVGAAGDGLSLPIMFVIMSNIANELGAGPAATDFVHAINRNTLSLVYLAVGNFVTSFLEGYCWTRAGERLASRMRAQYLKAVLRQDVGYFDLRMASTAEVITSVSSDSIVVQEALSEKVPHLIMNYWRFLGCFAAGFILMWRLVAVVFPTVVLLIIPGLIYGKVLHGLSQRIHMESINASTVAEQAIASIRTVYACGNERRSLSLFSSALDRSVRLGIRQGLAKGLALGANGITFSIWAFMAWYGNRLVMYHGANGGTVSGTGLCIVMGGLSLGAGLSNFKYLGEASVAVERVSKVMERLPPIDPESKEGEEMGEVAGMVEFKEVRFTYPSRPKTNVLQGFCLIVEKGETVALVGQSGSGKSTVMALLQRFYEPTEGEILLDGVDIKRLNVKWLRGKMGLVSQEPVLFATTIKENILFGKEDATMEEVVAAAKSANAHDFISQLSLGYDTQVGERGVRMSYGQKQRIAIARAIIRAPKILLLDEATSALDSESERIVQASLDAVAVGRTTIIIAHRLSTIRSAHSISVMHDGRVTEFGPHNLLIRNHDGHYSNLLRLHYSHSPVNDAQDIDIPTAASECLIGSANHQFFSLSKGKDSKESDRDERNLAQTPLLVPSFHRLLMMNAPEWRHAILGGCAAMLFGGVQPMYSYVLGSMIMVYFMKDYDVMKEKTRTYSLIFVGLSVISLATNLAQHYNLGVMGECLTRRIRERMLMKILTFEVGWFDQEDNSTGAICSRLAKDACVVRSLVGDRMSLLIQTLSAVIVSFTMGLIIAWQVALVMIATQPMIIICFYVQNVLLKSMSKKAIVEQSESGKLAVEAISNLRTIAAFSFQDRILCLFELAQSGLRRQSICQSWITGIALACSQSLISCIWGFGFWFGALLIHRGDITAKGFIQSFLIIVSTGRVIAEAGSITSDISKGANSVASVFSILDRISAIEPDDPNGHLANPIVGSIELCNVKFSYPSNQNIPILRSVSLSIQAGQSTALVGSSGSGKSTIIALIERFYDPQSGTIHIDGRDIRLYNLRSLRRHIALVGQEPTLFTGTIRENIAYGAEETISNAEIEAAARTAGAHNFISRLIDGYETQCGERGLQLSGGQKQSVAIARAIIRAPTILLLDEATSALDGMSEKVVHEALERVMIGRTSVVVAHKLSAIRKCNEIAVMDKGLLVEKGSHADLMEKGKDGMYYRLVQLQLLHQGGS